MRKPHARSSGRGCHARRRKRSTSAQRPILFYLPLIREHTSTDARERACRRGRTGCGRSAESSSAEASDILLSASKASTGITRAVLKHLKHFHCYTNGQADASQASLLVRSTGLISLSGQRWCPSGAHAGRISSLRGHTTSRVNQQAQGQRDKRGATAVGACAHHNTCTRRGARGWCRSTR